MIKDALASMSEEERQALIDQDLGWKHPARIAQRWIATALFVLGIVANVVFVFSWLRQ